MAGKQVSGSIPPERRLDPNTLWVMLLQYIPDERRLAPYMLGREKADDFPGGRPACLVAIKALTDLEAKLHPYLKRLPEDLNTWIGLAVTTEDARRKAQLLDDTKTDFLAWYYKVEV